MEQPAGSRLVVYRDRSVSPVRSVLHPGHIVAPVNASDSAKWPASNIHPTHEIMSEFDAGKSVAPGGFWVFEFADSEFWDIIITSRLPVTAWLWSLFLAQSGRHQWRCWSSVSSKHWT